MKTADDIIAELKQVRSHMGEFLTENRAANITQKLQKVGPAAKAIHAELHELVSTFAGIVYPELPFNNAHEIPYIHTPGPGASLDGPVIERWIPYFDGEDWSVHQLKGYLKIENQHGYLEHSFVIQEPENHPFEEHEIDPEWLRETQDGAIALAKTLRLENAANAKRILKMAEGGLHKANQQLEQDVEIFEIEPEPKNEGLPRGVKPGSE